MPTIPEAVSAAIEHYQAGRLAEAEAICTRVLEVDPGHPLGLHVLGLVAHQVGKDAIAVELLGKALLRAPADADLHNSLGEALRALGRPGDALACYDRALSLRPAYPEALSNRGIVLQALGHADDALASFDAALALRPDFADALGNRGNVLQALGRGEAALQSFDRALALRPDDALALSNRGSVLQELGRHAEALASCDRALALRPGLATALCNRGNVLQELGRYAEALACYDQALANDPAHTESLSNRGVAQQHERRHAEALASFDHAQALSPGHAKTHWNESLCRLLLGDYERGWEKYEWRWKWVGFPSERRTFAVPLWLGREDLRGCTILLHAEQGLGDTLQFVRYVPLVAGRGATVVLEVQPALKALLSGIPGASTVLAQGETPPAFDFHCPLLSLPLAFGTRLETVPAGVPYLPVDAAAVAGWREKLAVPGKRLVGVCWKGDPGYRKDRERSARLASLQPLLGVPGVRFVSLQKDLDAEEAAIAAGLPDFVHPGADFKSTAQLIGALDLVVTVDTAWSHWAGAIGKPLWVMLPHFPHWGWLLDREDSPWYPSARLFRQARPGDWAGVVARVRDAIGTAFPPSAA